MVVVLVCYYVVDVDYEGVVDGWCVDLFVLVVLYL